MLSANEIDRLCTSEDKADRLAALHAMRDAIFNGHPGEYATLALSLIEDDDNDCRWQALIVVGEYIETQPQLVWEAVLKYGASEDEDMRDGVATVLLEHLLEHRFMIYFPLLREKILQGNKLFADTLSRCWPFGDAIARQREVKGLLGVGETGSMSDG